jgi:excisionase family DNA binding protein
MPASENREILTIDEAAALLGVSVKTFNKVLHSERIPARKIGREWKFSRQALIDWVGSGDSSAFYNPDKGEGGHRRTTGWQMKTD